MRMRSNVCAYICRSKIAMPIVKGQQCHFAVLIANNNRRGSSCRCHCDFSRLARWCHFAAHIHVTSCTIILRFANFFPMTSVQPPERFIGRQVLAYAVGQNGLAKCNSFTSVCEQVRPWARTHFSRRRERSSVRLVVTR